MLRAASTKAVILVEGGDDEKVYGEFIDGDKCEIVICQGHRNARDALGKLEGRTIWGILCVVDADFSAFIAQNGQSPNLLQTDDHDLEVMLFKSRAFDKVLGELGSPEKVREFTDKGVDPRVPDMAIGA